jgi:hypothetical protein
MIFSAFGISFLSAEWFPESVLKVHQRQSALHFHSPLHFYQRYSGWKIYYQSFFSVREMRLLTMGCLAPCNNKNICIAQFFIKISVINMRNIILLGNLSCRFLSSVGNFYFRLINVFYQIFNRILPDFSYTKQKNIFFGNSFLAV